MYRKQTLTEAHATTPIAGTRLTKRGNHFLRASIMIKKSVFRFPIGGILRWFGGIPIDIEHPLGVVKQIIRGFRGCEQMVLIITPQGTRSGRAEFKNGFYRMAQGADVPILLGYIDNENKLAYFGKMVHPTGGR